MTDRTYIAMADGSRTALKGERGSVVECPLCGRTYYPTRLRKRSDSDSTSRQIVRKAILAHLRTGHADLSVREASLLADRAIDVIGAARSLTAR